MCEASFSYNVASLFSVRISFIGLKVAKHVNTENYDCNVFLSVKLHTDRKQHSSSPPHAYWFCWYFSFRWLLLYHVIKLSISPLYFSVKIVSMWKQHVSHRSQTFQLSDNFGFNKNYTYCLSLNYFKVFATYCVWVGTDVYANCIMTGAWRHPTSRQ